VKVLVLNSGSSSIKYQLFDMGDQSALATGLVAQIGEPESQVRQRSASPDGEKEIVREVSIRDHREGFDQIVAALAESEVEMSDLFGIGHRVVHGGEEFREPTLIDDEVIAAIRRQIPLAPLHNPANLLGIEVTRARRPDVPQVAVFDTAFHHSLPPHAYHYAIPYELYETLQIRRYGFHGTSHQYVANAAASYLRRSLESLNLIVLHLGNGASAAAIEAGRSVDTSMGMTPLEGLMMGTRCGDLDPAIVFFLATTGGKSLAEIEALLNSRSGLRGVCGVNDMREALELAASGDASSTLAIEMYAYRIKKYIGAYFAALGRVDAIIFTAGIGENSAEIRARSCAGLSSLGIEIDSAKNGGRLEGVCEIQREGAPVKILVVPTNEELEIAEETVACIRESGR
jgi:acetate kinase